MVSGRARKLLESIPRAQAMVFINSETLSDPALYYLTEVEKVLENAVLVIEKNKATLFDGSMQGSLKVKGMKVVEWTTMKALEKELARLSEKTVGVNFPHLKHSSLVYLKKHVKKARFVDVSKELDKLKAVKNKEEIKKVKKAASIACKALRETMPGIKAGAREKDIASRIDSIIRAQGAEPAFKTIVAFGKNSFQPHHVPGNARLKKGDFVLIDLGARCKHYCSDITRTIVLGKASEKQRKMYSLVLKALKDTEKSIRDGAKARKLHYKAKGIIEKEFENGMTHSAGHGIGLTVHEYPGLMKGSKDVLEKGQTIALEPGVYLKNVGGVRIEDDYLVEKKGYKKLSSFPTRLLEL